MPDNTHTRTDKAHNRDANPDPITGAPGSHPVGTGVGAAAGGAAGAGAGMAAGAAAGMGAGPVGGAIGAAVGAVVGGLEEQEVYIPLRREEALVERETRVREEVHARKQSQTDTQQVSEQIRKEDVEVERTGEAKEQPPRTGRTR